MWRQLVVGLKSKNRFTIEKEPSRFVSQLIDYAKEHKKVTLEIDTPLYRARINDISNKDLAFPLSSMGAPPLHLAGHGRLNPKGIPYLYLSSDNVTAVSEVRPWNGCKVTVAEFRLIQKSNLMNFSNKFLINIPEEKKDEGLNSPGAT